MTQITSSPARKRGFRPQDEPFTPWHKEPWAWYILLVILVTFCWGGVQLYLGFTHQDSVVVDDYYRSGKAINKDMTRTQNATALGIAASVTIDRLLGEVQVTVDGAIDNWPDQLILSFLSPVFADRDARVILKRAYTGRYTGQLNQPVSGRYYLQLETIDQLIPEQGYNQGWRITMEASISPEQTVYLKNPVTL